MPITTSTTATTAIATSQAFVTLVRNNGLLDEAELLPRSHGGDSWFGKFHPKAGAELLDSLPVIVKMLQRRKATPAKILLAHKITDHKNLHRIFDVIEGRDERVELNLYITQPDDEVPKTEDEGETTSQGTPAASPPETEPQRMSMKVAYWPGCVSRGFTPELHGSMEKIAPLLDIELVELDRASCCGAGVLAEHNQELADTLNARTFALAQQVEGADMMMNICSTCQGAQNECQQRLDANAEYRDLVNTTLEPEGLHVREGHHQQAPAVADGRGDRPRRDRQEGQATAHRPARRPLLRLLHRAPVGPRRHRRRAPA